MAPSIDPSTVKLATCQRILLKYDKEEVFDFRHYFIKLQPAGVCCWSRKLMQNNQVPDLRDLKDVTGLIIAVCSVAKVRITSDKIQAKRIGKFRFANNLLKICFPLDVCGACRCRTAGTCSTSHPLTTG